MGSKTLPADSSSTRSAASTSRAVKKEPSEDEIKDFAETAMNELLGWYGYDRVDLRRWSTSGGCAAGQEDAATSPESGPSNANDRESDECSWCNNPIKTDSDVLHHSTGAKFCSEICFSQSRRANFKRAKTCDWCRHVRHTVSYVDFHDGATQLQFCSDKCLNQYKMHIFCRETQHHIDLHPHLLNVASTSNLITPDLWLKNCKSRSVSPASDRTTSPAAENLTSVNPSVSPKTTATLSSPASTPPQMQKSPMPLITIAPPSKLMRPKPDERPIQKDSPIGQKKEHRLKMNSRKRRVSKCSLVGGGASVNITSGGSIITKPPDIRMISPISTRDGSPSSTASSGVPHNLIQSPPVSLNPRLPNLHAPLSGNVQQSPMFPVLPPSFLVNPPLSDPRLIRPPLFQGHPFLPRLPQFFPPDGPRLPFPGPLGLGQPPPVTILVPYPVILPLPLPIPVPIPLVDIAKAFNLNVNKRPDIEIKTESLEGQRDFDVPLDFTMRSKVQFDKTESNNDTTKQIEEICKAETAHTQMTENKTVNFPENSTRNLMIDTNEDSSNAEHTIPRFKITRLGAKMAKIVTKTKEIPESTRPLRKRRRLIEVASEDECNTLVNKSRKIVPV